MANNFFFVTYLWFFIFHKKKQFHRVKWWVFGGVCWVEFTTATNISQSLYSRKKESHVLGDVYIVLATVYSFFFIFGSE